MERPVTLLDDLSSETLLNDSIISNLDAHHAELEREYFWGERSKTRALKNKSLQCETTQRTSTAGLLGKTLLYDSNESPLSIETGILDIVISVAPILKQNNPVLDIDLLKIDSRDKLFCNSKNLEAPKSMISTRFECKPIIEDKSDVISKLSNSNPISQGMVAFKKAERQKISSQLPQDLFANTNLKNEVTNGHDRSPFILSFDDLFEKSLLEIDESSASETSYSKAKSAILRPLIKISSNLRYDITSSVNGSDESVTPNVKTSIALVTCIKSASRTRKSSPKSDESWSLHDSCIDHNRWTRIILELENDKKASDREDQRILDSLPQLIDCSVSANGCNQSENAYMHLKRKSDDSIVIDETNLKRPATHKVYKEELEAARLFVSVITPNFISTSCLVNIIFNRRVLSFLSMSWGH